MMVEGRFGHYYFHGLLGRGGMGEVYRAHDTVRDRMVALKLLPEHLAVDPSFVARFQREARIAARVTDPHLVPVHDFGEIDGRLYIDMALIDGNDLGSVLEQTGPMRPADAVGVLEQVGGALDTVHAAGLIHRDVKPSNVLLTAPQPGRPRFAYLGDFGIVRPMVTTTGSDLTGSQATVGTLQYMAPERFLAGGVDHLADVYALACVLYECLTGRRPYGVEDIPALIAAHLNQPVPRPSAMRPELAPFDPVVAVGMAKEPSQRYSSAGELMTAAQRALATPPAVVTPRPDRPAPSAYAFAAPPTVTAPPQYPQQQYPQQYPQMWHPPPTPMTPPPTGQQPQRRWLVGVLAGLAAALAGALVVTVVVLNRDNNPTGPTVPETTTTAVASDTEQGSTVEVEIPDNAEPGVADSVQLAGTGRVDRLQVRVDIRHPYPSDLDIFLTSPSGGSEQLISDNRTFGTDVRHTFDTDNSEDTSGTSRLAEFVGEPYDGEWTIRVVDAVGRDVGTFESWSIEVSPAG